MPYLRKRRQTAKKPKKAYWYDRKYSAKDLAIKALRNVNNIRGLVNSEMLKLDVGASTTPTNVTSQSLILLNGVAQGDGDTQRTGNSIYARALNANMFFEKHSSATFTYIRVMVVQDNQQISDTTPTVADVLESDYASHLAKTTVGRFTVLMSKIITLNSNLPSRSAKFNYAMRHHIRFNGSASSDVQKGAIYLLLISSEATNTPTVRYNYRLSFHDN